MPARVSFYRPTGHSRRQGRQNQFDHDVFEGLPIRRWDRQWSWVSQSNPPPRPQPELPLPKDTHLLTPLAQSLLQAARNGSLAQVHHQSAQDDDDDDVLSVSTPGTIAGSIAGSLTPSIAGSRDGASPDPTAPGGTKRLFLTNRWSCTPRQQEPPEPTYLSRMPDHQVRRTRKIQHRVNGSKVVFVDEVEETESSPPQQAVGAREVKDGSQPPSAAQTPLKKRPPPPRRKPGRGRKPGMKKGQSISSLHGGPQTPSGREGSVLNLDGDMEMMDADDSLMHTPASRVESDSAGSAVSTPDVRASAAPTLPELPSLTPQHLPEPPRSVPEAPAVDVEMANSGPSRPLTSVEPEPHPLSQQLTPPQITEPVVKTETPPIESVVLAPEPAPMESKAKEPAKEELAIQDVLQQAAAEHDLAQEARETAAPVPAPVEIKQIIPQKRKSTSPHPISPARTLSPNPHVTNATGPAVVSPLPRRSTSPPHESAAPTSLPTLKATPEIAPVSAPVLAPSPVPTLPEAVTSPPPAPVPAHAELAPTLPPVSIPSPPSTTQAHAQRTVSPKLAPQEESKPAAGGLAALLNGTSTPPASAEKSAVAPASPPTIKAASPPPPPLPAAAADSIKIPDVTSPSAAAAAGPLQPETVEALEKEAEKRVQTPPETTS